MSGHISMTFRIANFTLGITFVALASTQAMANPAGVIPYACVNGQTWVLLAYDPAPGRSGYAAFGGTQEAGESIAETAAREFQEETRCVFDHPDSTDLEPLPHSKSNGYVTYVAEVEYKSALQIEQHSCDAQLERAGWQWFDLENLLEALRTDLARPKLFARGDILQVTLWDKAADSMRQSMKDNLLVAEVLCPN
jgi:8-oxo-dGTP pyrophosphatase MutT (NUDIX family)